MQRNLQIRFTAFGTTTIWRCLWVGLAFYKKHKLLPEQRRCEELLAKLAK